MADYPDPGEAAVARSQTPDAASRAPRGRHRDLATSSLAWSISILAVIVGLIFIAWLVLYVTKGRFLKPYFEQFVSRSTERVVRVRGDFQFYFDPFDAKFLAEGLTISNPRWASRPNFFAARTIDTRLATFRLLFGERRLRYLRLDGGDVDAEWQARTRANTWTFGDPNKKGEPFQWPVIERVNVNGTHVRYVDPLLLLATDIRLNPIQGQNSRITDARVTFDGDGTLRGKRFTMDGALLAPNSTVAFGRTPVVLHARSGPTRLDLSGTLPTATQIEGADFTLRVRGPNVRLLFDFLGVAVPDTRGYDFRSHLVKVGGEYRFTRITGTFGSSDLAGRMTVSLPNDRLLLVADLASRKVDIIDIAPFIGYDPNALATKGVVAAAGPRTGGVPRLLPDAPLRIESIRAFDARVNYRVATIRAPHLPVSDVALKLDLDRSLLKLSPLTMDVSGGRLTSDIAIDARRRPVETAYDIRLSPTPIGKLFKGFGLEESGTTGVVKARVRMTGEGDTVRESLASADGRIALILPSGQFWTRNAQLAEFDIGVFLQKLIQDKLKKPIKINCGLIGFTVRDGVAAADPILIDTDRNVMTARGGFSFKDESVALAFKADAKKFSLFSAQSPVGIGGHFAAPSLQIVTPQLLARGGAGIALGVLGGPAAILAFVDPGDAKDTQCGPVLAGATAAAQRNEKGKPVKGVGNGTTKAVEQQHKRKKFLGIF